jgi:hypothetical protein
MTSTQEPAVVPHVIELEGWPPSPNARLHPLERYRVTKPLAAEVAWQARALGLPRPYERASVVLTWIFWRTCDCQDIDNAWARAKPLIDALKGIAIVDDDPLHCELDVGQLRVGTTKRKKLVRIEITPLPAQADPPEQDAERR